MCLKKLLKYQARNFGRDTCWSDLKRGRAQELKMICAGLPNESRECLERMNIYNRSISLQDSNVWQMDIFCNKLAHYIVNHKHRQTH